MASKRASRSKRTVGAPLASRLADLGPALIVEDDTVLGMMVADCLKGAGADPVSVCPSVASALGELDRIKPAILVLDVHLADRDDGWTMAELVIELNPNPPLIVFSTGSPERIPPRVAGMGAVLQKPFTPEQLLAVVQGHPRHRGLLGRLRDVIAGATT